MHEQAHFSNWRRTFSCPACHSACIDLKTTIRLSTASPGGLLIYDGTGSGKTSFCKSLHAEMIVKKGFLFHYLDCISFSCLEFKSVSIMKLKEELEIPSANTIWHQPCVILFDHLDDLIGVVEEVEIMFKTYL
jgi:hypothetical protein